jgi:hypothetical protein
MTKIINLTPYNITIVQGNEKIVLKAAEDFAFVYPPDSCFGDIKHVSYGKLNAIELNENIYLPPAHFYNEDDDVVFIVTEHVARAASHTNIKDVVFPFEYIVDDMELTNPNMTVFKFAFIG